jgi:hypothetical protein
MGMSVSEIEACLQGRNFMLGDIFFIIQAGHDTHVVIPIGARDIYLTWPTGAP